MTRFAAVAQFADEERFQQRAELRPFVVPADGHRVFSLQRRAGSGGAGSLRKETCFTSWISRNASYLSRQNSGE